MSKKKRSSKQNNPNETKDKSLLVHQNDKISRQIQIRQRPDLTQRQKEFLRLALDNNTKIIFVSGPSGSSKSFLAVLASLELINLKKVSDIIDRKSTRLNSSHIPLSRMPSSA